MALTPEQIELLTEKYIVDLYSNLEREVIGDISRRLRKAERFTETAELQAKFMTEQGFSAVKIRNEVMKNLNADPEYQKFLAENTKEYKTFVKEEIAQTVKEAKEAGNKLVAEAGTMAWNDDLQMWAEHGVDLSKPSSLSQIMTAFRKQTVNELKNITKTTGFKGTTLGTTGVMSAFQKEMDMAVLKTVTGTFSYQKATNDCIKALAQSGLRSIDYASGRSMNLDTAARMIVRTSCSQLAGKITEANMDATGTELVYVSAHDGARPEHAEWQGKVYTYSGEPTREYPDFVDSTGYGDVDGLKGVNCTHNFYPYWEGASVIPEYTPADPVEIDGKEYTMYEATQEQRKLERQIRELKREKQAQIDSGKPDKAIIDKLNSKIKLKTDEYKKFSSEAGLRVKSDRLTAAINSGKAAQATVQAIQKTTTRSAELTRMIDELKNNNVKYNAVSKRSKSLTEAEIIDAVSGGDQTSGSCVSVALAYAGQKAGLDVLDYRGGESLEWFSEVFGWLLKGNLGLPDMKVTTESAMSQITAGKKLLRQLKEGSQYFFTTGYHAAIVKKENGLWYYLELQSPDKSGWVKFDGNPGYTLSTRFGAVNGKQETATMFDIDSVKNSDEFRELLGYINTASGDQEKGKYGRPK